MLPTKKEQHANESKRNQIVIQLCRYMKAASPQAKRLFVLRRKKYQG